MKKRDEWKEKILKMFEVKPKDKITMTGKELIDWGTQAYNQGCTDTAKRFKNLGYVIIPDTEGEFEYEYGYNRHVEETNTLAKKIMEEK